MVANIQSKKLFYGKSFLFEKKVFKHTDWPHMAVVIMVVGEEVTPSLTSL